MIPSVDVIRDGRGEEDLAGTVGSRTQEELEVAHHGPHRPRERGTGTVPVAGRRGRLPWGAKAPQLWMRIQPTTSVLDTRFRAYFLLNTLRLSSTIGHSHES
jgi:hypothetical protein